MFSNVFAQIDSRFKLNRSETGFHDPSARVATISTFDKGVDASRQFVRFLLTLRNSLMPISVLPPEILARVFHFLVREEMSLYQNVTLGWIKVTHVCQQWRQVALDDLSLWAKIWGTPVDAKWISERLVRAKNAPLDIELNVAELSTSETFLMIPPHLSHTRQLRFHNLSTYYSDYIREIFSCEAPALEHLEFGVNPNSPIIFQDLGGNMLFKGHAPRLRTLSLEVAIPWSLVPRGQLTQLKIASPEAYRSPGDLNHLIDLLVNCPELQILVLESCLPSQLTEFPHGRTIHLPRLSHLRLRDSTSWILNMLKMLKLPSSTTLHLNCFSADTSHNDSEGLLLLVISAHFQSVSSVEFKSLTVSHRTKSLNITASTFPSTLRNRQTQKSDDIIGNSELVLSFDCQSMPGHLIDLLKQACKMLPLSNLEFISMSVTNTIDINWVELFGCFTNVNTVHAIGLGTSSLVHALTAPAVTNAGSSKKGNGRKRKHDNRENTMVQPASTAAHAHAALFPNLKFLGLTKLKFSEGKHDSSGILFHVFERGLQQRMGAPLGLLRICDCQMTQIRAKRANDLQRLKKLVQDFHLIGEL